jgi:hypothetical protein
MLLMQGMLRLCRGMSWWHGVVRIQRMLVVGLCRVWGGGHIPGSYCIGRLGSKKGIL